MGRDRGPSRGFREVDIAITSVQPGVERSGRQEDNSSRVFPAYWRNNLTGLSQRANLYFVGVLDQVHVYQPDFPTQRLQKRIFSWRVAATSTSQHGFICPGHPHWINRLAIGDYGTEEVLATAHDEGDFIVCTIRSICHAIEACRAFDLKPQDAADRYLKYMCRRNVSASAWGIAIHQNARLLAVSANTKHVTVFAPALVSNSKTSNAPSNIADRIEDKGYLLAGHEANIPCIAFCNTDGDRDGRFLVSADINGGIIIWDIWKQCGLKKIAMSIMPEPGPMPGENFLGWSVTCIDERSFRSTNRDVEFVGYNRPNSKKSAAMVDISPARKDLRDFQFWHEPESQHVSGRERLFLSPDSEILSNDFIDGDDEDELDYPLEAEVEHLGDFEDDEEEDADEEDEIVGNLEFLIQAAQDMDQDFDPFGADLSATVWHMLDRWEETQNDDIFDNLYDTIDFGPSATPNPIPASQTAVDRSDSANESAPPLPAAQPLSILDLPTTNHQPPFAPHSRESLTQRSRIQAPPPPAPKPPQPEFPFSILHSGKRIVTLLRPPFDNAATVCIDPCHEHLPPEVFNLGSFERLNLTSYIPELGVAVIATQKGRAAIFTLTTLPLDADANEAGIPHLKPSNRRDPSSNESTESTVRYALRLDWVLPFKSQETRKERPWSPLLGVATAPVQGSRARSANIKTGDETSDDVFERFGGVSDYSAGPRQGRWRLFLTYAENTVLTYDLFREEGGHRVLLY